MSVPFFSVIVPTYNRAEKLSETIESILGQEFENWQLVIVDDGSTDNTLEVINEFTDSRIKYVKTENRERAAARNTGIKNAIGDYITFLDSDDHLYPDHLKKANDYLTLNESVAFFRLAYEIKDASNKTISQTYVLDNLNDTLIFGNFLSCLGVFVKKEILAEYSFNEDRDLSGCEDYELWLRLATRYELHGLNDITAALQQHGDRSVLYEPKEKLIKRVNLLYSYLLQDKLFVRRYMKDLRSFRANNFTYISLHLAISKYKGAAFHYLIRAFFKFPGILFRKRLYAILKLILS